MLRHLTIQNVVLIESLSLDFTGDFAGGLSCFTGETGAGKSILLDSISLVLGGRGSASVIRTNADKAVIAAEFEPLPLINDLLVEAGLEPPEALGEDTLRLKRIVSPDGKSRAFINDQPCGIALLKSIGAHLVEIQGQFDQHALLDEKTHLGLLDDFAKSRGGDYAADLAKTRAAYTAWQAARKRRVELEAALSADKSQKDYLEHVTKELAALAPEDGEEAALTDRRQFLMNAEKIAESIQMILTLLDSDAAGDSANDKLAQSLRLLDRQKNLSALESVTASLTTAQTEMQEAVHALHSLLAETEADPGELSHVDERLFKLQELARKHQVSVAELPAKLTELQSKLAALEDGDHNLDQLLRDEQAAQESYMTAAHTLSHQRKTAAESLSAAITAELPPLKFTNADFRVEVATSPAHASANGIDTVTFTARTNAGTAYGSLSKVASGGELSRFMLAIKAILAQTHETSAPIPTLIFDEVDAGVSGATAEAVGQRLASLGEHVQVLVVTHSPQVTGRAAHHYKVIKSEENGATTTSVTQLAALESEEEIARMLSGATITDAARQTARELKSSAAKELKAAS